MVDILALISSILFTPAFSISYFYETGVSFPWRLLKKRRFCDTIIAISRAFAEATEKPGGNKNEQ